jgi:hypothetical protein
MNPAYADEHFRITPGGGFEWSWTDWLGVVAVLIGIAFLLTVIVALVRGESPLAVLAIICRPLAAIFGKSAKEDAPPRLDRDPEARH